MRIFHIATVADWDAARATGRYTTSTRGRTLAEEGFIHASRGDQWQAVRERWYAGVEEPLVLLVVDPELLTSPVIEEEVPGGEVFPHVYGPIDVAAVVRTIPLDDAAPAPQPAAVPTDPAAPAPAPTPSGAPSEASFSRVYFQEMFRNLLVASIVLAVVVAGTLLGGLAGEWGPITGAVVGLVVGVLLVRRLPRPAGR
ncbi:DUF952 domain-containing protein [Nocardioides litoris]|uniref:DUF952 domain-containing protein n=1 Tax=Nocardioides litoris TaxID=1926648 RepID=UPI00111D6F6D|nr:DUF952 domain-containing protein [Nocardioides litoris]